MSFPAIFQFSPFHASTFLTSGSDREIRIYSLLQPLAPVKIIYTQDTIVSKLSWCQFYKILFFVSDTLG
jgi:hypothetical protein